MLFEAQMALGKLLGSSLQPGGSATLLCWRHFQRVHHSAGEAGTFGCKDESMKKALKKTSKSIETT